MSEIGSIVPRVLRMMQENAVNIFGKFVKPTEGQIEKISNYIGKDAYNAIEKLGTHVLVPKHLFEYRQGGASSKDKNGYLMEEVMNFGFHYEGRWVEMVGITRTVSSSRYDITPDTTIGQPEKTVAINFSFEKDQIEKGVQKAGIQFLRDSPLQAARLELVRIANSKKEYLSQSSKQKNVGLKAEGIEFMRNMQNLINMIDPSRTVLLKASDEQRQRIYARAFRDKPNVSVILAE